MEEVGNCRRNQSIMDTHHETQVRKKRGVRSARLKKSNPIIVRYFALCDRRFLILLVFLLLQNLHLGSVGRPDEW